MQQDKMDKAITLRVMSNLRTFNAHLKMQQAVLTLIIHQLLSAEEVEDQKRLFARLDLNRDGMLQREELVEGFREIYGEVVEQEVDEIMALADLNGNGELDYSEWLVATSQMDVILTDKKLKQAFLFFDRTCCGRFGLQELKDVMGQANGLHNEVLEDGVFVDILAEADENADGEIDFDEFRNMMHKLVSDGK
jgi:calcium-dependent protein kinase